MQSHANKELSLGLVGLTLSELQACWKSSDGEYTTAKETSDHLLNRAELRNKGM